MKENIVFFKADGKQSSIIAGAELWLYHLCCFVNKQRDARVYLAFFKVLFRSAP